MPYVLSPVISRRSEGLWMEGAPYTTEQIYRVDGAGPPVNYEAHTLKPHSLPHFDAPNHISPDGKTIEWYFENQNFSSFCGWTFVIRFENLRWKSTDQGGAKFFAEVSVEELKAALGEVSGVRRLLMSAALPEGVPASEAMSCAFTLSEECAEWLIRESDLKLLGTSWKSTDFQPGSRERPIHKKIFEKALVMECLDLEAVPVGHYYLAAFPIPLQGASEAPVCPVLLTQSDLLAE